MHGANMKTVYSIWNLFNVVVFTLITWLDRKTLTSPSNRPWKLRAVVEACLYSPFDVGAGWEWVVSIMLQPLYSRERYVIDWTGGWVGPTAGLGGCGKPRPYRDSTTGQPTPYLVGYDRMEYQIMKRLQTDNTSRMVWIRREGANHLTETRTEKKIVGLALTIERKRLFITMSQQP
jgi:hypothetical protein